MSNGELQAIRAAATLTLAHTGGADLQLDGSHVLGAPGAPVSGSGDFDFAAGTGTAAIDLPEYKGTERGTEHVVFQPERVLVQPKAANAAVLPKNKQWVSATLTGRDSVKTNFPAFTLQVEAINPSLLLNELALGAQRATPLGGEKLGSVPTRRYDVEVDLQRALAAVRGPAASILGEAIQSQLSAPHARGLRAKIRTWVDDTGVIAKLQASPLGAGVGTATFTMCCFDERIKVRVPPPSQVVDLAALTPSGERESNGGGDSDGG